MGQYIIPAVAAIIVALIEGLAARDRAIEDYPDIVGG